MDQTGEVVVTTTAVATTTTLAVTTGIPVMGVTRETGVSSPTDLPILVPNSPGVPLRAIPTQFALLVDVDTQESVVELLVLVSSLVKLAIYRRISRRTPLYHHGYNIYLWTCSVVLFDTGATHSVISSAFASRVTTTPMMID
nr:hypothetical protein [Tanacetum cinerariifolium]